ncbi:N-substituted formamide deformylase precursor [Oxobacter pfennigii]|uniref:N-substituted formamide deformylase n=1 Tax=Oxobacter pfennigii TaxID=36849 RepID=A0A0P8YCF9_9CLOT|nr:amidohydrolase [Oxobacter pfennigii]KPU44834.1 N-substituted formamide deformylase precursor [Oxobacter pfennigii]
MDLILINGKIVTMDDSNPCVQAVAVDGGKIVKIGNNKEIINLKCADTRIIDLEGKLVLPGFNDSHMHLLSYGANLYTCDLSGTESIEGLIHKMKDYLESGVFKAGQWIHGQGWNHDYFAEGRFPTRYDLDRISTEYPICIARACTHVSVVNSKALETAGITKDTSQVDGGHFDLDENGEPLGIFRENALSLIYNKIPELDKDTIKNLIKKAAEVALKEGITSIQTDDFGMLPSGDYTKIINAYKELSRAGELPLRINQQCLLPDINILKSFLNEGYRTGMGTEFYRIGPLKLLADGSLGARTAYLTESYKDDPSTKGIPVYSQAELDELVVSAHDKSMQIAIHSIGDASMYMAFESIEKALNENSREDHRHAIVHCQITDKTLLNKFKSLDVVALIQPIFIKYDLHMAESRVGYEKAKTSYNFRTLFDMGVNIACGSDCPVEPFNVLHGIYCAVTRKDLKGYPEDGWFKEQSLSVEQAVYGYTIGAAYASFEENIKGSITPGKLGDFVVLSRDIFTMNLDEIKDAEVLMTFVGGKLAYKK